MNKIILAISLTTLILVGCSDVLNVEPESVFKAGTFYSNEQEADIAIAGMIRTMSTDEGYGRDLSVILEAGTDEGYYNRTNDSWQFALHVNSPVYSNAENVWTAMYETINLANLLIENIDPAGFEDDQTFNAAIGEARFLRALCYFNLTNFWEEVPLRLQSTKDQSGNNVPAAPLGDMYDAILSDFDFASQNLYHPTDSEYIPGRASKLAAHGLMARVYMKMSGYPLLEDNYANAIARCDSVIMDGFARLNPSYPDLFRRIIGGPFELNEVLYEIPYQNLRDRGLVADGRHGAINGVSFGESPPDGGVPSSFGNVTVTPTHSELYTFRADDDDTDDREREDDERFEWNIAQFARTPSTASTPGNIFRVTNPLDTRRFTPGKFRRWEPLDTADIDIDGPNEPFVALENSQSDLNRTFTAINFPILRYSDVLLMRAEAENALNGPTAIAIGYLNEVRNRAGLPNIEDEVAATGVTASREAFFNEIVDERSRELCFEALRRFDLVRWQLLGDVLQEVEIDLRAVSGFNPNNANHTAGLRPSQNFDVERHMSLPYPLVEVTINQALDQKPEWQ